MCIQHTVCCKLLSLSTKKLKLRLVVHSGRRPTFISWNTAAAVPPSITHHKGDPFLRKKKVFGRLLTTNTIVMRMASGRCAIITVWFLPLYVLYCTFILLKSSNVKQKKLCSQNHAMGVSRWYRRSIIRSAWFRARLSEILSSCNSFVVRGSRFRPLRRAIWSSAAVSFWL